MKAMLPNGSKISSRLNNLNSSGFYSPGWTSGNQEFLCCGFRWGDTFISGHTKLEPGRDERKGTDE